MRTFLLLTLLVLFPHLPAAAAADDFSGVWVAWLCPAEVKRESGQCANFVLELLQQEDKVCGAHLFASAGAAQLDEGAAPSVVGDVAGGSAAVVAVSGRAASPLRVPAELKMQGGALRWRRLENPPGDHLLPAAATLAKAKSKTLFAPLFAHQLKSACSLVFGAAMPVPQPLPSSGR